MKVRLVLVIAILPMIVSCQQVVKNIEVNEALDTLFSFRGLGQYQGRRSKGA